MVVGHGVEPSEVFWLDADAGRLVCRLSVANTALTYDLLLATATNEWVVDSRAAARRLKTALGSLVRSSIIEPIS